MVDLFVEIHDALKDYAHEILEYKEKQGFKKEDWIEHEIYAPKVIRTEEFGTWVRMKPTGVTKKYLKQTLQTNVFADLLKLPSHEKMIGIVYREIAKETNKDLSKFMEELSFWGKSLVDMRLSDSKFAEQIFYDETQVDQIVNDFAYGFIRKYPPTKMRFRVFLRGVLLEGEELDAGIFTIRKPIDSDFPQRVIANPLEATHSETHEIHSVLEWSIQDFVRPDRGRELWEIRSKIELLRLGIGGNWRPIEWNSTVLPETPRLAHENSSKNNEFHRVYGLWSSLPALTRITEATASWFRMNGGKILKRIWSKGILGKRLRRAIKMLEEATFRDPIETILFSIIGFETLFSLSTRQELRLKSTLQVATMIHLSQWARKMVAYDDVEMAYTYRNKFVHGDDIEDDFPLYLGYTIREHLRACILMWTFAPVESKGEMEKLNAKLLRASFDDAIEQDLQQRLKASKDLLQNAQSDYRFRENVKIKRSDS